MTLKNIFFWQFRNEVNDLISFYHVCKKKKCKYVKTMISSDP